MTPDTLHLTHDTHCGYSICLLLPRVALPHCTARQVMAHVCLWENFMDTQKRGTKDYAKASVAIYVKGFYTEI